MKRSLLFLVAMMMPAAALAVTVRPTAPASAVRAATRSTNSTPTAGYAYNYMYPYLNNQMRTDLNPGVTPSQAGNPISVIARTEKMSSDRRVVPRAAARSNTARSAAAGGSTARAAVPSSGGVARAATSGAVTASAGTSGARRVVSRSASTSNAARAAVRQTARNASPIYTDAQDAITSDRCLADYTRCMNSYCQREKTSYNRCYCSARLAQIDAQYQPAIDSLIKQLLTLRGSNHWTDAEMNDYWMDTIGKYTGGNSWANLDEALNINWADTDSRVRGQNAFVTGHDYCVQHLRGCAYMASNLRDAYRSEIARDCSTYESSLQRLKNAAESLVNAYSE